MMIPKPGPRSSEFVLTAVALVVGLSGAACGEAREALPAGLLLTGLAVASYNLSRGIAKGGFGASVSSQRKSAPQVL